LGYQLICCDTITSFGIQLQDKKKNMVLDQRQAIIKLKL
jgi:hypothetical protein